METEESATGSYLVRQLQDENSDFVLELFGLSSREAALATLVSDPAHTAGLPHPMAEGSEVVWEAEGEVEPSRLHTGHSLLDVSPAAEANRKYKGRRPDHFVDIVLFRLLYLAFAALLVWILSAVLVVPVVSAAAVGVDVVFDPRRGVVVDPGHASPTASGGRNICD